MRVRLVFLGILLMCCFGCTSVQKQKEVVRDDSTDRISVGTVQREIRKGMSGADVVAALGSPNMVTSDGQQRETWVYDKVSTERVSSNSSGGIFLILGGVQGGGAVSSTTQRTLTIIIKFDEKNLVRDYSYRQSSF